MQTSSDSKANVVDALKVEKNVVVWEGDVGEGGDKSQPNVVKTSRKRKIKDESVLEQRRKSTRIKIQEQPVVEKIYNTQSSLRTHMLAMHGNDEMPWQCESCKETFATLLAFRSHMRLRENCVDGQETMSCYLCRGQTGLFRCNICGHTFATATRLAIHWRRHGQVVKLYRCRYCSKPFEQLRFVNDHIASVHRHETQECSICGVATTNLDKHVEATHLRERFQCPRCPETFKHSYSLRKHERLRHTGQTIFRCDLCGWGAPDHYYMQRHMQHHEEHVDDTGAYLPLPAAATDLTRAGLKRPVMDGFASVSCGADSPGIDCCRVTDQMIEARRLNVLKNSRFSDTSDLRFFVAMAKQGQQ